MADEVKIVGMRELYEALSTKIPRNMEAKVLQKALAAGTAVTLKQARRNAPKDTGVLRRALFAKRSRFGQSPTMEVRIIGVRKGKKAQKNNRDAYYARWIEYGHRARTSKRFPGPPVFVPAQPFLRPAFESTKNQALQAILAKLPDAIEDAKRKSGW